MSQENVNVEAISSENDVKVEWKFFDENGNPVHLSKVIYKNRPLILVYPYSYSSEKGIIKKKIKTIELRGWNSVEEVPTPLRVGKNIKVTVGSTKHLMSFLYKKFPRFEKLIIDKNGRSRFSQTTITFNYQDFDQLVKSIGKEVKGYEVRRKTAITNSLAKITNQISPRKTKISKGQISHYLNFYSNDVSLSNEDIDSILSLISIAPSSNISVTENFIQTKDKINVAYLDDVICRFESLLKIKKDNEKDWQKFFEQHGWILANLFPFQVVMKGREAYVGGKTIENKEGRVVDFLFQNGFEDNYALLEIKTHRKALMKNTPYRSPDTYAVHEELSGAISQCLDQKNTFLTDFGQKYKVIDPKVILVTGMKSSLNESQTNCFELVRANQKNVDLVTFDELLEKIKGLKDILNQ